MLSPPILVLDASFHKLCCVLGHMCCDAPWCWPMLKVDKSHGHKGYLRSWIVVLCVTGLPPVTMAKTYPLHLQGFRLPKCFLDWWAHLCDITSVWCLPELQTQTYLCLYSSFGLKSSPASSGKLLCPSLPGSPCWLPRQGSLLTAPTVLSGLLLLSWKYCGSWFVSCLDWDCLRNRINVLFIPVDGWQGLAPHMLRVCWVNEWRSETKATLLEAWSREEALPVLSARCTKDLEPTTSHIRIFSHSNFQM